MASTGKEQLLDVKRTASADSLGEIQGEHPCIAVPRAFRIYCDKSRFRYAIFYIGRTKGDCICSISHGHKGWLRPTISLHEGPSVDTPVIGSALLHTRTVDVTLPRGEVQMSRASIRDRCYDFSLPVGSSGTMERFQWRRSRGQDVKNLGSRGRGWKLMRLDGPYSTSQEQEVVAVYTVELGYPKLSGRFEFLHTGATDALGRDWAIMTIVTALSLGHKERQAQVAASTSG